MSGPAEELTAALAAAERLILHTLPDALDRVASAARAVVALVPDMAPAAVQLAEQVLGPPGRWHTGDPEPPNPVGMRVLAGDGREWIRRGVRWAFGLDTAEWHELLALGPIEEVRGG